MTAPELLRVQAPIKARKQKLLNNQPMLRMLRLIGGGMGSIIMVSLGLPRIRMVLISRSGLMSLMTARIALVVMGRLVRLRKPQRPGVLSRI